MSLPSVLPDPVLPELRGGPVLRWGVLAPGRIAGRFTHAIHEHTDQRVHAVGSRSAERAEAFASEYDIDRSYDSYEQLVEDAELDAIYIASPHSEHLAHALLAIGAGKHVLIEKPIAVTAAEAQQIADAARDAGVFAMEAMHTRFHPRMSIVRRLLDDGALGELRSVAAELAIPAPPDPEGRLLSPKLAGGALLDLGVYTLWFNHFAMGKPDSVVSRGLLAETGVDAISVTALTSGSILGSATVSIRNAGPNLAAINGSEGRIHLETDFAVPGPLTVHGPDGLTLRYEDTTGIDNKDGLCRQAVWMAQHVAEGLLESPLHPLSTSIEVLATIDEARGQLGSVPLG